MPTDAPPPTAAWLADAARRMSHEPAYVTVPKADVLVLLAEVTRLRKREHQHRIGGMCDIDMLVFIFKAAGIPFEKTPEPALILAGGARFIFDTTGDLCGFSQALGEETA